MDSLRYAGNAVRNAFFAFLSPHEAEELEPSCENTFFYKELALMILHVGAVSAIVMTISITISYLRSNYTWPTSLANYRAVTGRSRNVSVQVTTSMPLSYAKSIDHHVKTMEKQNERLKKVIRSTITNVKKNICIGDGLESTTDKAILCDSQAPGNDSLEQRPDKHQMNKAVPAKRTEDQLPRRLAHLEKINHTLEMLKEEAEVEEGKYMVLNNKVQEMWICFKETEQKLIKLGSTAAERIERLEYLEIVTGEHSFAESETESEQEVASLEPEVGCMVPESCYEEEAMLVDEDNSQLALEISSKNSVISQSELTRLGLADSKYAAPIQSFADSSHVSSSTLS